MPDIYKGLLLKESLEDETVLDLVGVTKVTTKDIVNNVSGQPKKWTFVDFTVKSEKVSDIAKKMSISLEDGKWYLSINGKEDIYIVFPNKIFHYKKNDLIMREEAINYGRSIGIPDSQLDWSED